MARVKLRRSDQTDVAVEPAGSGDLHNRGIRRHGRLYRIIATYSVAASGRTAVYCQRCKACVVSPALRDRAPRLKDQLGRGSVVLGERMYVVQGPEGTCDMCAGCCAAAGFQPPLAEGDGSPDAEGRSGDLGARHGLG